MEGLVASFVFILSLWALTIGLVWLLAALLPAVREAFPYSLRSSLIVLAAASFSATGSLGFLGLQQGLRALSQLSLPWQTARVTILSDPEGAWVLLEGELLGQTPLELELPVGQVRTYLVTSDPRAFTPFQGVLQTDEDVAVSVWLERRSESELQRFILEEEAAFLGEEEVSEGLALLATARHQYEQTGRQGQMIEMIEGTVHADRRFAAVVAAVALYNEQDEIIDIVLGSSGPLKAGETWTFLLPVTHSEVASHRLLRLQGY